MSLIYTQLASDNFQRADEEPLNPANWTSAASILGGDLAVVSDLCVGQVSNQGGGEIYTGISFPDDQYASINTSALTLNSVLVLFLRVSSDQSTYYIAEIDGAGDGTGVTAIVVNGMSITSGTIPSFSPGDTFLFSAFGSTLTLYQNGVSILSIVDNTLTSGSPGLSMFWTASQTDTSVSLFTAGSVSQATNPIPVPVPPQVHEIYAPIAYANNVLNINTPRVQSNGVATASGPVAPADLQNVDDERPDSLGNMSGGGSNTIVIPNEGSGIILGTTTENHQVQKTVHGRFDKSTVINNPA